MNFSLRRPTPGFSAAAGPSDLSFQLSNALGTTSQLLLEDDPDDFLAGMDSTLATPTPAAATQTHTDNPLTLAELTPRSRRTRSALKFTPSPRKRGIPSLLKHAASHEIDITVEDSNEATPVKNRPDTTFQIPRMGNDMTQLLMSGDDLDVLSKGAEYSFLNTTMLERAPPLPLHRPTSVHTSEVSIPSPQPVTTNSGALYSNSQHLIAEGLSKLRAQVESLVDSDQKLDIPVQEAFSDVTSLLEVPTEVHENMSCNYQDNQGTLSIDGLEEPAADAVQSVSPSAAPGRPTRLSGRRSTGKQTVISGGIVKRSKLSGSTVTNALRSKAIGKRPSTAQSNLPRKRDTTRELKIPLRKATIPIRVTTSQSRENSRKVLTTNSTEAATASSSRKQHSDNLLCPSHDDAKLPLPTASTHIARSDVPTRNTKAIYEDSAAVQPSRSNKTSTSSTAVDRDLDRALNDDARNITHNQRSPSDDDKDMTTGSTPQPEAVHYAQRNLTSQPGPVELERDVPGMLASSSIAPPSPMRRSAKRSAPDTPDDEAEVQNKRGRTSDHVQEEFGNNPDSNNTLQNPPADDITRPTTRVLRSSRAKNNATTARVPGLATSKSGPSVSRTATATRTVKKPGTATRSTSRQHTVNTGGPAGRTRRARQLTASSTSAPDEPGLPGSSTFLTSSTSVSGDSTTTDRREVPSTSNRPVTRSTFSASLNDHQASVNRAGSSQGNARLAVSLPLARATVPIEFHFHSEARIEARKRSDLAESKDAAMRAEEAAALGVPDFKTLHDAEEKRLASRKHQITPILPGRIELSTEARAHEREKYDEARRAREAEAERLLEEQRRLQAIEEEKEIKELRRRAVPKANEVPDWYAHAPKLHKPREHQ